jgi:hypothetical protein
MSRLVAVFECVVSRYWDWQYRFGFDLGLPNFGAPNNFDKNQGFTLCVGTAGPMGSVFWASPIERAENTRIIIFPIHTRDYKSHSPK